MTFVSLEYVMTANHYFVSVVSLKIIDVNIFPV